MYICSRPKHGNGSVGRGSFTAGFRWSSVVFKWATILVGAGCSDFMHARLKQYLEQAFFVAWYQWWSAQIHLCSFDMPKREKSNSKWTENILKQHTWHALIVDNALCPPNAYIMTKYRNRVCNMTFDDLCNSSTDFTSTLTIIQIQRGHKLPCSNFTLSTCAPQASVAHALWHVRVHPTTRSQRWGWGSKSHE